MALLPFAFVPMLSMLAFLAPPALDLPEKYRQAPPAVGKAALRVNGAEISSEELTSLLWQWRVDDVAQDAISYLLVKQATEKVGFYIGDEAVEKALEDRLKSIANQLPTGQTIDTYMQQMGFNRSRLFLRMKTELLLDGLLEKNFDPKKFIRVSTLIVRVRSEQAEALSAAIADANKAYDRLKAGESWEKVLSSSTTDASIVQSAGQLGWRELAAFPASVQEEMKMLSIGGITKPAQTTNGIQIFRIDARAESSTNEEVQSLKAIYLRTGRERYLLELRQNAKIEKLWQNTASGG
jgi:parvulin-like peptidyl-prolyl isomerase